MPGAWDALRAALVDDNRRLIESLREVIVALEQSDGRTAQQLARQLDRRFGPHIEFQERYLYPEVEKCQGEAQATRLYEGNERTIAVLVQLQRADLSRPCCCADRCGWPASLRAGVEHAALCGQLLTYLQCLAPDQHAYLLQRLRSLQCRGHRWAQLHPIRDV